MKRVSTVIVVTALVLGAAVAQAQDKAKVGVLDVRKVLLESKPGQKHKLELEGMIKERREKLMKEENNIKALREKLDKDKLVMTDKQREQRQQEIEDKMAAFQKAAQEAQQQVARREQQLSGDAGKIVQDIVDEVAKQEKLTMVIDRNQSAIIWVEERVDITDKVLKAYEAKAGK